MPLKIDASSQVRQDTRNSLLRWFGNSNLVDAEGEPLRLYHGSKSNTPIDQFVAGGISGSPLTGDAYGVGCYLTTSAHEASIYAGADGAVYPVYARGEMLRIPLNGPAPLPHSHAERLSLFAQMQLHDFDKAKFQQAHAHLDFQEPAQASIFFEEQRDRWEKRGFGYDWSFPEVVEAPDGGFRVKYTDFDAPIHISTTEDAWQLLRAVGFDIVSELGFDGLVIERADQRHWVICHKTGGGNIKSVFAAEFDGNSPYLVNLSEAQIQRAIALALQPPNHHRPLPRDLLLHLEHMDEGGIEDFFTSAFCDHLGWTASKARHHVASVCVDGQDAPLSRLLQELGDDWQLRPATATSDHDFAQRPLETSQAEPAWTCEP